MNYLNPDSLISQNSWQNDPYFNKGKLSISWHRDPGLASGTSVAVYTHQPQPNTEGDSGWRVGIRRLWDCETPAILVGLNDGDAYYMLDDFGALYEHAVYAGKNARFSSTHRHLDTTCPKSQTYDSLYQQSETILQNLSQAHNHLKSKNLESIDLQLLSESQDFLTNLEHEWIRQFWGFGSKHAELQSWWVYHINILEQQWVRIENETAQVLRSLGEYVSGLEISPVQIKILVDLSVLFKQKLSSRAQMREEWWGVYTDPVFANVPSNQIPIQKPTFTDECLPEVLNEWLEFLENYPKIFNTDNTNGENQ